MKTLYQMIMPDNKTEEVQNTEVNKILNSNEFFTKPSEKYFIKGNCFSNSSTV